MNFRPFFLVSVCCFFHALSVWAHKPPYLFSPNKGQWHENVLYRTSVPGGEMYLERDGISFSYHDAQKLKWIHDNKGKPIISGDENLINAVVVRSKLLGANANPLISEDVYTAFYENWFLGNDPSRFVSKVFPVSGLRYHEVYPRVDWVWKEEAGFLKFEFVCKVGSNPAQIQTEYTGQKNLYVDHLGNLITVTDLNTIKEEKPYAYQIRSDGSTIEIPCRYKLDGQVVSYEFPTGFDASLDLIIDPTLVFSTYSGSNADNFGFTATYDSKGYLYSGGNVFGLGYYTTPGAFQVNYGAGNIDCAISKYDTTGTFMVWSSYLGGTGSEMPHSMVVNKFDQLFVYGSTGSPNFPVTANAYDQTFNGGTNLTSTGVGYTDVNGSDIFISRFSVDGTQLLASTYLGGSANDGLNLAGGLNHNYADLSRGEIDIDNSNAIYLATTTASSNFPTTVSVFQPAFGGGGYDGVVLKMDNSLTTLIWSTYLGGSSSDAVYSLAIDKTNNIVVTGGTLSADFPVNGTDFNVYNGGVDAFVTKINATGTQIMHSILYGTAGYNQSYFVELDASQNVYVFGQTNQNNGYFFTGGSFGNTNGNQFITKFSNDLSNRLWSTSFGNQQGIIDISPTAFLVDVCSKIYLSGWGGQVNSGSVPGSTMAGLPITPNAYQSNTNGSDFYIMVFEDNLSGITYGTYFGGPVSAEHVDGGTSRFSRKGEIYQSVCAGCGSNDDFPFFPPNGWSATNNSFNCNNGVFKFKFEFPNMLADFDIPPSVCAPASVNFQNFSSGATNYFWDFGNGQTSTQANPSVVYNQAGIYTVMLAVTDSNGVACNVADTIYKIVTVLGQNGQTLPAVEMCEGSIQEIGVPPSGDPSVSYLWIPSAGLSDASAPNPIFNSSAGSQTYQLVISNSVCSDTLLQSVTVSPLPQLAHNDTLVCSGIPIQIGFSGAPAGMLFSWSPANLVSDPNAANPTHNPQITQDFSVVYGFPGCLDSLSFTVNVLNLGFFNPVDTAVCPGDTIQVNEFDAVSGLSYTWSPNQFISNTTIPDPLIYPLEPVTYTIVISNGICSDTVTKSVAIIDFTSASGPDDTLCIGQSVIIGPSSVYPGLNYSWTPSGGLSAVDIPNPSASPAVTTTYILNADAVGSSCAFSDTVTIAVSDPVAPGFGFSEFFGCYGGEVTVSSNGNPNYQYAWFTNNAQTGAGGSVTFTVPYDTTIIFSMVVTGEGCTDTLSVVQTFESFETYWGDLIVPNVFTPNNDEVNDCFGPSGAPEGCYFLYVYNRWGVLMFDSYKLEKNCWNGKYMKTDSDCVDGVYFWVLEVGRDEYHGTVTLSRGN